MFNSLNKKFVIAICLCFLCTSVLFIALFTHFYSIQISKNRNATNSRIEMLNKNIIENIELKRTLFDIKNKVKLPKAIKDYVVKLEKNNPTINKEELLQKTIRANTSVYEERYEAISRAFNMVLIGAGIIIFSLFIYWLLINRYVIKPIDNLVDASEKIADGKYDTRIENYIVKEKADEIERLIYSFNSMADSLEKSIKDIKEKEQFQQSLIDAIPDGIRVIDEDFNVVAANREYKKETDCKKIPVKCYKSSYNINKPCSEGEIECPVRAIMKNHKRIKTVQKFYNSDNYSTINSAPLKIKDKNGKEKTLVVESIRNISEDIKFSHQQKLSSIGLMASSVAHEMRNPLGSVRLIIEAMSEKIDTKKFSKDEFAKYLSLISGSISDCIDITERLLKLSRMPNDKKEVIDVKLAINDVVSLLDYEAKKSGVSVKVDLGDEEILLNANDSEIRMMLLNLLQNAFHAMKDVENPEILVKTSIDSKNKLKLSINDNGKGIEKEKISKIFDPFFTDKGTNKEVKGTGLGLTITKNLVEKFKGKIEVKSQINKGTSFLLTFPVAKIKK